MKNLIINADDFGFSLETNHAIKELVLAGKITSTSILTKRDKEAFADALSFAKLNQNRASFGLHLDLSDYFKFDELALWGRDEKHIVSDYKEIILNNKKLILNDIKEQFEVFRSNNLKISHVDGHHHIHLFHEILEELVVIMKEYEVNKMRFFDDFYLTEESLNKAKDLLKRNNIITPDNFIIGIPENENSYLVEGLNEAMIHVSFGEKEILLERNCFSDAVLIDYKK